MAKVATSQPPLTALVKKKGEVQRRQTEKEIADHKPLEYYWEYELVEVGKTQAYTYRQFDFGAGQQVRSGEVWEFAWETVPFKGNDGKEGTYKNITNVLEKIDPEAIAKDSSAPAEAPRSPGERPESRAGTQRPPVDPKGDLMARESALKTAAAWCGACVQAGIQIIEDETPRNFRTSDVINVAEVFLGFIFNKKAKEAD